MPFFLVTLIYPNLYFSEYAEGSSNNKYLEIYNNSDQSVDLTEYAFPNSNNGATVVFTGIWTA